MLDDARLDTKLQGLTRELMSRPLVPGVGVAGAFATQGMDETGRVGLFAAVLLTPTATPPDLDTLTALRQALTAKLKQLDTRAPSYPIVVQGAPEVIDASSTVPGGPEYFEQVKTELLARRARMRPRMTPAFAIPVPPPAVESRPRKATGRVSVKAVRSAKRATRRRVKSA